MSLNEMLKCDHSNESCAPLLSVVMFDSPLNIFLRMFIKYLFRKYLTNLVLEHSRSIRVSFVYVVVLFRRPLYC